MKLPLAFLSSPSHSTVFSVTSGTEFQFFWDGFKSDLKVRKPSLDECFCPSCLLYYILFGIRNLGDFFLLLKFCVHTCAYIHIYVHIYVEDGPHGFSSIGRSVANLHWCQNWWDILLEKVLYRRQYWIKFLFSK